MNASKVVDVDASLARIHRLVGQHLTAQLTLLQDVIQRPEVIMALHSTQDDLDTKQDYLEHVLYYSVSVNHCATTHPSFQKHDWRVQTGISVTICRKNCV